MVYWYEVVRVILKVLLSEINLFLFRIYIYIFKKILGKRMIGEVTFCYKVESIVYVVLYRNR